MMAQVLVTRPQAQGAATAAALEALSWRVLRDPLFTIVPKEFTIPPAGFQAVLLSSANAAFALSGLKLPVYTVGVATAEAAIAAGARDVRHADGDALALMALVAGALKPEAGPLLYLAGTERAIALAIPGFTIHTIEVYQARPAEALLPATRNALIQGKVAATLLYSPRAARQFRLLLEQAGGQAGGQCIVCLSNAVAEAAGAGWKTVRIAAAPNEEALFKSLTALNPECYSRPMTDPTEGLRAAPEPEISASNLPALMPALDEPAPPRKGNGPALAVALLALLTALASPYAYEQLKPVEVRDATVPVENGGAVAALTARLDELETAQQRLLAEAAAAPEAAPAAPDDTLRAAVADLSARLALLEEKSPRPDELENLKAAVVKLDEAVKAGASHEADAAQRLRFMALLQLTTALQQGEAFASAWTMLAANPETADRQVLAALENATTLTPWRDQGVPTLARLQADFPSVARQSLKAEAVTETVWWRRALDETTGLVTIRRQGEVEGDTPEAVLARAEVRLNDGALDQALDELKTFSPAPKPLNDWLARAEARLAADRLMQELTRLTAASLIEAPTSGAAP